MLRRNIHLSPDVILAAMPKLSSSSIDPYTNHEKVSWVMNGAVQQPIGLHMVKPFSKIRGFHKQMGEVLRAVMELEGNVLHGTEREHAGIPSELEGDEVQCKEQDQADRLLDRIIKTSTRHLELHGEERHPEYSNAGIPRDVGSWIQQTSGRKLGGIISESW
ncbi:uncharacterized protein K444DRAFT_364206 [Hyaloscypha bicolor E]|uniref:Uncharacterized protein n=1 Tax=Hyaloscypha bicolor E TaxID=1095630 RepID=A0A2J6TDS1_9HELO|nr:uncharacterized protein K444DRAFT_364206 [Hyaloscypha bicolor E]PMD61139.1 hypothetical protein K444DRAFT_364206 [Hyaloscypha bicolor E]